MNSPTTCIISSADGDVRNFSRPPTRLSAHIGYLFTERPLAERVPAASAAGFDAVEHPAPFAVPAAEMARLLNGEAMAFSQIAAGTGDAARGEKGLASLPGREADFLEGVKRSADYAAAVGCSFVHPMAGVPPKGADRRDVWATYVSNLEKTVELCAARGLRVLVEAISEAAVPGYFISTVGDARRATDEVGRDKLSLLVDTFHARANGLDASAFVRDHVEQVGHVHIADHPGRHEPGTGLFDFSEFLAALDEAGYRGAIGFEYIPASSTAAGLGWLREWLAYPSLGQKSGLAALGKA